MSVNTEYDDTMSNLVQVNTSLEVVKHDCNIALPAAYLGKIKESISSVLNAKLQKFDQQLDGIPVSFNPQNVKLLSPYGSILTDQSSVHFTIQSDFIVFRPKLNDTLKGIVNKIEKRMIGCLVHNFFYCSVDCSQAQSNSTQIGSEILFRVTQLEDDGHGLLSIVGVFQRCCDQQEAPVAEIDSGIEDRESAVVDDTEIDQEGIDPSPPSNKDSAALECNEKDTAKKERKRLRKEAKRLKREKKMRKNEENLRKKEQMHKDKQDTSDAGESNSTSQQQKVKYHQLKENDPKAKKKSKKVIKQELIEETVFSAAHTSENGALSNNSRLSPTLPDCSDIFSFIPATERENDPLLDNTKIEAKEAPLPALSGTKKKKRGVSKPQKRIDSGIGIEMEDGAVSLQSTIDEVIESVVKGENEGVSSVSTLDDIIDSVVKRGVADQVEHDASSDAKSPVKHPKEKKAKKEKSPKKEYSKQPSLKVKRDIVENVPESNDLATKSKQTEKELKIKEYIVEKTPKQEDNKHILEDDTFPKNGLNRATSDADSLDLFVEPTNISKKSKKAAKRKLLNNDECLSPKLPKLKSPTKNESPEEKKDADLARFYLEKLGITLNDDLSTSVVDGKKAKKIIKKEKKKKSKYPVSEQ